MGFPAAKPSKNLLAELSQSAFKFMNNEVTMDALAYNLGISDTENIKNLFINMHDLTSTFSSFNEKSKYLNS